MGALETEILSLHRRSSAWIAAEHPSPMLPRQRASLLTQGAPASGTAGSFTLHGSCLLQPVQHTVFVPISLLRPVLHNCVIVEIHTDITTSIRSGISHPYSLIHVAPPLVWTQLYQYKGAYEVKLY